MSLREGITAEAQAAWFDPDGLAQAAVYQAAAGGASISLQVVVQYGENLGGQGRYLMEEMTALVPRAQVTQPQDGDNLTLADGTAWTVRKIKGGDALGIGWLVACTKGVRATLRGAP